MVDQRPRDLDPVAGVELVEAKRRRQHPFTVRALRRGLPDASTITSAGRRNQPVNSPTCSSVIRSQQSPRASRNIQKLFRSWA
jgi:hypothetical protein